MINYDASRIEKLTSGARFECVILIGEVIR